MLMPSKKPYIFVDADNVGATDLAPLFRVIQAPERVFIAGNGHGKGVHAWVDAARGAGVPDDRIESRVVDATPQAADARIMIWMAGVFGQLEQDASDVLIAVISGDAHIVAMACQASANVLVCGTNNVPSHAAQRCGVPFLLLPEPPVAEKPQHPKAYYCQQQAQGDPIDEVYRSLYAEVNAAHQDGLVEYSAVVNAMKKFGLLKHIPSGKGATAKAEKRRMFLDVAKGRAQFDGTGQRVRMQAPA